MNYLILNKGTELDSMNMLKLCNFENISFYKS